MANYRKSFNFRTGLQVDNDNFVVNANGLVGIGTSIPENYLLNVYGDTRVTGVVTTSDLNAGVGTVSTLTASNSSLGVASVTSIRIGSGPVITNLIGYAYSTFSDDGVGGISTTTRIGIGTTADLTAQLKVLGDSIFTGNIDASTGIVTASSFVGNITGTVTGTATTATNLADGANITTGTISNDRLPTNINKPTGIITASSFVGGLTGTATTATNLADGANITTGTISDARLPDLITSNINVSSGISTISQAVVGSAVTINSSGINTPSGIITASSFVGGLTGTVTGTATTANNLSDGANITTGTISDARLPDLITSNISIASGISTFNDLVASNANLTGGIVTATTFIGSLTGTATTANNLSDGANITTGTISNDRLPNNINKPTGIITASSFVGDVTGTATTATNLSDGANITTGTIDDARLPDLITSNISIASGISTVNELNVGTDGAGLTALSTGNLGIGTTNPTSELLIRKSTGSLLEVISDSGQARISIGNSVGVGNSSGVLRFGSAERALEFVNRDTGNINMLLHAGGAGINTGRFDWIYGQTNDELMSLTHGGSLGIGITNPSNTLHVVGTSTVTGNAWVGGDLSVDGNISGTITLPSLITSNTNVTSGVSTFNTLDVTGIVTVSSASSIGIGTTSPIVGLDGRNTIALFSAVGVNTDQSPSSSLVVNGVASFNDAIGIGSTAGLPMSGGPGLEVHNGFVDLFDTRFKISSVSKSVSLVVDDKTTIGIGSTSPQAAIDLSNAGKGAESGQYAYVVLPKSTTAERAGFASTEAGAVIFNTDTNKFQGYTGTAWADLH